MRKKMLRLAAALVVLAGVLVEAAPRDAAAATCPWICSQVNTACRSSCEGDAACLADCYANYRACCGY